MLVDFLWYAYYAMYTICLARFCIHTGVLALPIPAPHVRPRQNTNKRILIQYPVRNEPTYLVNRFLRSLLTIPKSERYRITVQILDDYDQILDYKKVRLPRELDGEIVVCHLKRKKRQGNKAGNLNYGLSMNDSPYVAIYDSDHQMDGAGLIDAVNILEANKNLACVQSRWVFDNEKNTLLSLLQQQFVGFHINREQTFRSRYNLFPIFNGAGAVWNRSIVEKECGGWLERCVCEDTDLSGVLQMRNYQIHVEPTWVTRIDLVETWSEYKKQQRRWIQGNGQQLQLHIRDPHGWNWKKLYWISWNSGFGVGFMKYIIPLVVAYKVYCGLGFNFAEYASIAVHLMALTASAQTWDNKLNLKGLLTYPAHYILELPVLHHQIKGFWQGLLNWNKHIEFIPTKK